MNPLPPITGSNIIVPGSSSRTGVGIQHTIIADIVLGTATRVTIVLGSIVTYQGSARGGGWFTGGCGSSGYGRYM